MTSKPIVLVAVGIALVLAKTPASGTPDNIACTTAVCKRPKNSSAVSLTQRVVLEEKALTVDEQEADTELGDSVETEIDPAMKGYTDPNSDIDPAMSGYTDNKSDMDPTMATFNETDVDPAMAISDMDPAMANVTEEESDIASIESLLESGATCKDDPKEYHCADLARRGDCTSNRNYMAAKCPRSCCECNDQVGTIYGIGMNYNIYKRPKCSPTNNKGWTHTGRGNVYNIELHTSKSGGSTSVPYLYGIGMGHNIYKQPLCSMTPHTHWHHTGRGSVYQIVIHKDDLYGIGFDHRVWKQGLRHLSPHSHWHCVTPGSVRFIHIDGPTNTLYGVGMGGHVYSQNIHRMTTHTSWQLRSRGWVRFILTHNGWMYGIGGGWNLWRQRLSTMSRYTHWTHISRGNVHHIEVSGGSVYGIGMGNGIWRQSLSTMSPHSHWTHIAHGSVSRTLIDSHCGEKPPVGRWKFILGHSAGQTISRSVAVTATDSKGRTLSKSQSVQWGVTISASVNFVPGPAGGIGGSAGIEVSRSTTNTISNSYSRSFSHSQSYTDTASCAAKKGQCPKLWQWILEDENNGRFAATAEYLCTYGCQEHSPECPVNHCKSATNLMCSAGGCIPWGANR